MFKGFSKLQHLSLESNCWTDFQKPHQESTSAHGRKSLKNSKHRLSEQASSSPSKKSTSTQIDRLAEGLATSYILKHGLCLCFTKTSLAAVGSCLFIVFQSFMTMASAPPDATFLPTCKFWPKQSQVGLKKLPGGELGVLGSLGFVFWIIFVILPPYFGN